VIDMLGNVWEWTISPYETYPDSRYQTTTTNQLVVRGGCYDYSKEVARISSRGRYLPGKRNPYLGFRIAATPNYTPKITLLRDTLSERFNESELRDLCTDLGIDYENIPHHSSKLDMARELALYISRRNLSGTLLKIGLQKRDDINWRNLCIKKPFPSPSAQEQNLQNNEANQ
jgi:hypothetical protein